MKSIEGTYDIYLVFKSSGGWVCNINWLQFSKDIYLSSEATITSKVYKISQTNNTITDIPSGMSISTSERNLEPAEGATFITYLADGKTEANELSVGCKVIKMAEDGVTINTYTVEAIISVNTVLDKDILIYPNPVSDMHTISNTSGSIVEIYNTVGKINSINTIESAEQAINIIGLSSGYNLVRVIKPEGIMQNFKMIKK